jgi:hypothetical protein
MGSAHARAQSKLAYLALCRSIQLLVLLARGDTAKDLEILVTGTRGGIALTPETAAEVEQTRPLRAPPRG